MKGILIKELRQAIQNAKYSKTHKILGYDNNLYKLDKYMYKL